MDEEREVYQKMQKDREDQQQNDHQIYSRISKPFWAWDGLCPSRSYRSLAAAAALQSGLRFCSS
jgi:hypothetical protein